MGSWVSVEPINANWGDTAYSLLPLAEQGKDEAVMKSLLDAHGDDLALHKKKNLRLAVRARHDCGAETWLGRDDWEEQVALSQHEMVKA